MVRDIKFGLCVEKSGLCIITGIHDLAPFRRERDDVEGLRMIF